MPAHLPRYVALVAPLLIGGLLPLPCRASPDSLYREARPAMGTMVEIHLYASTRERAAALFEAAFQEIERVEQALSTYRPTSEMSRINANAASGPVVTDPEVFNLLDAALDYSIRTDGAFDITVGALVNAWGFFRGHGRYPPADELSRALARVGWRNVILDHTARTVQFRRAGIELDLGGIGKGFALDRAALILRRHGVTAALLGAGRSSYCAIGAPPDTEGWRVVVPDPHDPTRPLSTVWLHDRSLSTSGSGEKFFALDSRRYSHIIDPRTGEPVTDMVQVTVTARRAVESDALATGLFVLGADRAGHLLESTDDAAALLVTTRKSEDRVVAIAWGEVVGPAIR